MIKFLTLFLICSSALAETYKLECEIKVADSTVVCFGNAFAVSKKTLMTCWHLVEGKETHRVLVDGKWHTAKVVKKDEKKDLCLIKIEAEVLKPVEFSAAKVVTVGSEKNQEIKVHPAEVKTALLKSSYNTGISGSPVFEDGKLIGMILSVDNDVEPTESTFVSSAVIKKFLE